MSSASWWWLWIPQRENSWGSVRRERRNGKGVQSGLTVRGWKTICQKSSGRPHCRRQETKMAPIKGAYHTVPVSGRSRCRVSVSWTAPSQQC